MIDLNYKNKTEYINTILDEAIQADRAREPKRDYLGASLLGHKCARHLQFEYFHTPPDNPIGGRTYRIFERGHRFEDMAIQWFKTAGFNLRDKKPNGYQFEFSVADGRIKGHCDGVFVGGPGIIKYPALWECKALGNKYWQALAKHKLKKERPVYYGQVNLYMAYFGLAENPALFTAINADTMELYHELVPFDAVNAQECSDRGVQVIKACDAGELLPRVTRNRDYFECKMCSFYERCWRL